MNFQVFIIEDKLDEMSKTGIAEYEKRLTRYCKTKIIFVKNSNQIENKIKSKSKIIKLTTTDIQYTSEEFANKINKLGVDGISNIVFIIGEYEYSVDEYMSLSKMDLDIGTLTTILFEQIYRGYRILNNHPYHK